MQAGIQYEGEEPPQADEGDLRPAEMVEQPGQIIHEGIAAAPVRVAREAEAAMVEGDDAVRLRQRIKLTIPDRMVAADAVREHHRGAGSVRLPVYFGARGRQNPAVHHDTPINLLSRTT